MKATILTFVTAVIISMAFTSCGRERFVDSRKVKIWNYDTIPMDIYVNGEKAAVVDDFFGEVNLLSGDYEIVAKSGDKEIDKVNISLSRETEDNTYNHFIFLAGQKKNYALIDVADLYDNGNELKVEETFFNTNYIELEYNTYRMYWPWSTLPMTIYGTEGNSHQIFQLIELPAGYEDKSDEDIIKYCSPLIN